MCLYILDTRFTCKSPGFEPTDAEKGFTLFGWRTRKEQWARFKNLNSDCHLFSKARKLIYRKLWRGGDGGRNVEKDRNEWEEWTSGSLRSCLILCPHIWPGRHPDPQEMTSKQREEWILGMGVGEGVKVRNADRLRKDPEGGRHLRSLSAPLDSSSPLESLSLWLFGPECLLPRPPGVSCGCPTAWEFPHYTGS